ncbi:MAG: hypothetical protein ACO1QS_01635 [Verrucomicrobiota bacterium]
MRRFSGVEIGMLIVASLFIVCGAVTVIRPGEGYLLASTGRIKGPDNKAAAVRISKGTARGLGIVAVLFGAGFVWLVFQKPEEK